MNNIKFTLWLASVAGQLFVCALLLRGRAARHPAFRAYIITQTACDLAALLAWFTPSAYFAAYYIDMVATSAVTMLCALEVYRRVFGWRASIPLFTPEKTGGTIAAAFGLAIILALLAGARYGGEWTRAMVSAEQGLTIGSWAAFVILAVFSRRIFLPWLGNTASIAGGFVLYLSVDVVTVFIRSWSVRPAVLALAGEIQQAGYLLAVGWWCLVLRKQEEIESASAEEVRAALDAQDRDMEILHGLAARIATMPAAPEIT